MMNAPAHILRLFNKYKGLQDKYWANPSPFLCEKMLEAKDKLNEKLKTELKNKKSRK